MTAPVELDGGLECDDLFNSRGGLRLGLQGREGGFDGVEVGYVGLVVFLVVQLHNVFDDMRFEGLFLITKPRVIIDEIMLYYISPRRYNAEENGHDDNDDDDDDRDLDVRLTS